MNDAPDHFAPHDALFYRLMQGELGTGKAPGKLRRYRIDLRAKTLREDIQVRSPAFTCRTTYRSASMAGGKRIERRPPLRARR
jgi:hypothetical protein